MTLTQVAAAVMRVSGISWLMTALVELTLLPGYIYRAEIEFPLGHAATGMKIDLVELVVRFVLHSGLGVAFLFFSCHLAVLVTKGLQAVLPPPTTTLEGDASGAERRHRES